MIQFDKKFFEGEERDGFYIESEMKRAWAAEMEVLAEIDRICKKHNITYFADSGTLLGAVRHNGFIPWDDDIDIAMLRSDYMKFIRVAKEELEPPMICLHSYQDGNWREPFGRVVNGLAGIELTPQHLERYHGCPYSVGVDIFILDSIPSTEAAFDATVELYEWVWSIRSLADEKEEAMKELKDAEDSEELEKIWDVKLEQQLTELEKTLCIHIDREKKIANQLLRVLDGLFAMYDEDGTDEVINWAFMKKGTYHNVGKKKEWYRESISVPFENITIEVPIEFHKMLEKSYGPKYLEPVKTWHFHNYPFYKENKRRLEEARKDVRNVKGKMNRLEELLRGAE